MRRLLTLCLAAGLTVLSREAAAVWDPLQKAERAALDGARRFAAGDSLGAVEAFLKAQALAPDDTRIRMGLAEALYKNGEFRSALGQYRLAGEAGGEYGAHARYNAGNAAFEMGELERALEDYTEAVASGDSDPDLLHNLELTQRLLEQAQQQQEQGEKGEPQDGDEGEQQEQQDGSQQQEQQQEGEQQEQPEDQEGEQQEQESDGEEQGQSEEQQEAPALPDSMPPMPALADSLAVAEGMTAEQAMRLLDALDHDEEELRRSIQRRLQRGDAKSENDW
ncbi:MAG TPA: tetratricopeptide repeat protein [Candidatus Krumholzibacteria bacterium]|jgi:Ca-activated chloride channel family protein